MLALFAGWLTDWLPAGSLTLPLRRLAHRLTLCLRRLALWLTPLRNSCLKLGMCGRYSEHLVPLFVSALWRVGYWGNVCCVFTMHSSEFILGIANRCHGYRFAVEWQRHSCTGDSVAPAAARHSIIHPSTSWYPKWNIPFRPKSCKHFRFLLNDTRPMHLIFPSNCIEFSYVQNPPVIHLFKNFPIL
jgi:hypothetical protein